MLNHGLFLAVIQDGRAGQIVPVEKPVSHHEDHDNSTEDDKDGPTNDSPQEHDGCVDDGSRSTNRKINTNFKVLFAGSKTASATVKLRRMAEVSRRIRQNGYDKRILDTATESGTKR
jgi:hypothetical protein